MRIRIFAAAALCALGVAAAAPADDAILQRNYGGALILEDNQGRAIWELQAMCAGFHRATAAYWTEQQRPDRARKARIESARATNRVVLQLKRDRGITDRDEAIRVAAASEQVGVRLTEKALAKDGMAANGQWNFWRSFCTEADRAFFAAQ